MFFFGEQQNKVKFIVEKDFEYQYDDCVVFAKNCKPTWFDNQPLYQDKTINPKIEYEPEKYKSFAKMPTIAGCPAIKDFYECGYVIKSWSDILITKGEFGEIIVQTPSSLSGNCEFLDVNDLVPGENPFINPIIRLCAKIEIKTSRGISLLQTSCLENFDQIKIFEGYVPTDVYPIELKVPFGIVKDFDEIFIPYGTPLIRLTPVKRTFFKKEKHVVEKLQPSSVSKCPFFKLGKHLQNLGWTYSRNYFK